MAVGARNVLGLFVLYCRELNPKTPWAQAAMTRFTWSGLRKMQPDLLHFSSFNEAKGLADEA